MRWTTLNIRKKLVPDIMKAYNKLSEMYDIIVIEGREVLRK